MIRVGIGGWVFKPWRGEFYPKELSQARELEYASRKLTTIEINGTFYSTQKPESFRKWAAETPDDFVFSLKAPRYATHRRVLAEAGKSIERFFASGVLELKAKLGPVLWQFHPGKKFEPDDFAAFLALLPPQVEGRAIRHVVEVRHESFPVPEFIALLRKFSVAAVLAEFRQAPDDRRCHRRFRLCPAAAHLGGGGDRLSRPRARRLGQPRADLGRRRRAGRSCDHRGGAADAGQARCLHLHDLGRQGARAGRRDGADRPAQVRMAAKRVAYRGRLRHPIYAKTRRA